MRKQLKVRKFELLPNSVWTEYLLPSLCRTEQFTLSATCKWCHSKCGMHSFRFSEAFDLDNRYWRENFFNFVDAQQDATLLFDGGKFEELTHTQRRQLKYFIKFWSTFVAERERRKQQRALALEQQRTSKRLEIKIEAGSGSKTGSGSDANDLKSKSKAKGLSVDDDTKETVDDAAVDDEESDPQSVGNKESFDEKKESVVTDTESNGNGNNNGNGDGTEMDDEAVDDDDLYAEDEFVYDDEEDDRGRGEVLLERIRSARNQSVGIRQDAALRIAIPCSVEQLMIRGCKNRSGELANWVSSVLCHVARECPVDWLGLENNNFADRDVIKICQGLFGRATQSNLVGLSLSGNGNISDKCIQVLLQTVSKKCHKLQFLRLSGCSKLTNKTCQHILDFYSKTYDDDNVQLNCIDLSDNPRINEKGITTLNEVYLHPQYAPYNVVPRFCCQGTQFKEIMAGWSKNIILRKR